MICIRAWIALVCAEPREVMLLLFFYPERRDCLVKVINYLRSFGINTEIVEDRVLRALVKVPSGFNPRDIVENVDCVSRVGVMVAEVPKVNDLNALIKHIVNVVGDFLRSEGMCVAVRCRRWDKSYPFHSVEVARSIAKELESRGLRVSPRCSDELLVAIDRDRVLVALVKESWIRVRKYVPRSLAKRVTCVACMVQGAYELADLIQLARALGIEMALLNPRLDALNSALKLLGMSSLPPEVKIVNDFSEIVSSVDVAILLSRYGSGNERTLVEIAKRFKRIALVVGNEYSDPPPDIRDRCRYSVRLGPETGKPMRSCIALAYALGIVFTAAWGALGDEQS